MTFKAEKENDNSGKPEITGSRATKSKLKANLKSEKDAKMVEKSQINEGFSCPKCDQWFKSERNHSKHIQTCSVLKSIENKDITSKTNAISGVSNFEMIESHSTKDHQKPIGLEHGKSVKSSQF